MRDLRHVASLLVILAFAAMAVGTSRKRESGRSSAPSGAEHRSTMAFVQCKSFVTDRVKGHSTPEFPSSGVQMSNLGNDTYVIRSHVDHQDSVAATIRSVWTCRIRYRGGAEADQRSWELVDLEFMSGRLPP